jgi:hypothetical protein
VFIIAELLNVDKDDLLSLWLASQVTAVVEDEQKVAGKALRIARQKLKK